MKHAGAKRRRRLRRAGTCPICGSIGGGHLCQACSAEKEALRRLLRIAGGRLDLTRPGVLSELRCRSGLSEETPPWLQ
jgi:hypothetical protein